MRQVSTLTALGPYSIPPPFSSFVYTRHSLQTTSVFFGTHGNDTLTHRKSSVAISTCVIDFSASIKSATAWSSTS